MTKEILYLYTYTMNVPHLHNLSRLTLLPRALSHYNSYSAIQNGTGISTPRSAQGRLRQTYSPRNTSCTLPWLNGRGYFPRSLRGPKRRIFRQVHTCRKASAKIPKGAEEKLRT